MNLYQAAFRDIVVTELKRQVVDPLNDSNATPVEESFMKSIDAATNSSASQKKLTLSVLIDVWVYRMIWSGPLDSGLTTQLSSLSDLTKFTNSIIRGTMN